MINVTKTYLPNKEKYKKYKGKYKGKQVKDRISLKLKLSSSSESCLQFLRSCTIVSAISVVMLLKIKDFG